MDPELPTRKAMPVGLNKILSMSPDQIRWIYSEYQDLSSSRFAANQNYATHERINRKPMLIFVESLGGCVVSTFTTEQQTINDGLNKLMIMGTGGVIFNQGKIMPDFVERITKNYQVIYPQEIEGERQTKGVFVPEQESVSMFTALFKSVVNSEIEFIEDFVKFYPNLSPAIRGIFEVSAAEGMRAVAYRSLELLKHYKLDTLDDEVASQKSSMDFAKRRTPNESQCANIEFAKALIAALGKAIPQIIDQNTLEKNRANVDLDNIMGNLSLWDEYIRENVRQITSS